MVPELNLAMIEFHTTLDSRRIAFMDLRNLEVIMFHQGTPNAVKDGEYIPSDQTFLVVYDNGLVE